MGNEGTVWRLLLYNSFLRQRSIHLMVYSVVTDLALKNEGQSHTANIRGKRTSFEGSRRQSLC